MVAQSVGPVISESPIGFGNLWPFQPEPLLGSSSPFLLPTSSLLPCFLEVDCGEEELDLDLEIAAIEAEIERITEQKRAIKTSNLPSTGQEVEEEEVELPASPISSPSSPLSPPLYSLDYLFYDQLDEVSLETSDLGSGLFTVSSETQSSTEPLAKKRRAPKLSNSDALKNSRSSLKRRRSSGAKSPKLSKEDLQFAISNLLPADKLSGVAEILYHDKTDIFSSEIEHDFDLESVDGLTLQRLEEYVQSFVPPSDNANKRSPTGPTPKSKRISRKKTIKRKKSTFSSEHLRSIFQAEEVLTLTHQTDDEEDIDVVGDFS